MANVDIDPQNPYSAEEVKELLCDYEESGATFVEFSVAQHLDAAVPVEVEAKLLGDALDVAKDSLLIPAVYTSYPKVMASAAAHGEEILIATNAF